MQNTEATPLGITPKIISFQRLMGKGAQILSIAALASVPVASAAVLSEPEPEEPKTTLRMDTDTLVKSVRRELLITDPGDQAGIAKVAAKYPVLTGCADESLEFSNPQTGEKMTLLLNKPPGNHCRLAPDTGNDMSVTE